MKKFLAVMTAVLIFAFSSVSAFAASVNSPTAPTIPPTAPVEGEVIVSVSEDLEWEIIYAYYYTDDPTIGAERESVVVPVYVDENGNIRAKVEVPDGAKYVIFHNGNGEIIKAEPVSGLDISYVIDYKKNPNEPSTTPTSPQTGDNYTAVIGLMILLAAAAGVVSVKKLAK